MEEPTRQTVSTRNKDRRRGRGKNYWMFQDHKGRWWLDYYTPEGRRKRKLCGTHEQATTARSEIETAKKRGTYVDENAAPFFDAYADHYLEKVSTHKESYSRDVCSMKNLKAYFGRTRVSRIKRSKVREYRESRLKTVSGATVNREIALLRHMFNVAIDDGTVSVNPARGGPGLKAFKEQRRERYLEMREVDILLAAINARIAKNLGHARKAWTYLRAVTITALHTGMRKSEIFNLRWVQINWEKQHILLTDTKNNDPRRVPMDSMLVAELAAHRQLVNHPELVFPSYDNNGNTVPLKSVKVGFSRALTDAGITNFRFHDLRHTFASHYVMSGGDLYALAKILGHRDIKMTQRYADLSPDYVDRERKRMDSIWTLPTIPAENPVNQNRPNYVQ